MKIRISLALAVLLLPGTRDRAQWHGSYGSTYFNGARYGSYDLSMARMNQILPGSTGGGYAPSSGGIVWQMPRQREETLDGSELYRSGRQEDCAQAVEKFNKGAARKDPWAQYYLGLIYERGDCLPADEAEARRRFTTAGKRGVPIAAKRGALMAMLGRGGERDPKLALKLAHKAGQYRDHASLVLLGFLAEDGASGTPKREKAIRWFKMAAEHGDPIAAQLLLNHPLTLRDPQRDAWKNTVRLSGYTDRDFYAITLVWHGWGNPKREGHALGELKAAADAGDRESLLLLYQLAEAGGHSGLPRTDAETYLRRAAGAGHPTALRVQALTEYESQKTPEARARLLESLRRAAANGDDHAGQLVGLLLGDVKQPGADIIGAWAWLKYFSNGPAQTRRAINLLNSQLSPTQRVEASARLLAMPRELAALREGGSPLAGTADNPAANSPTPAPTSAESP